jgi:hypothetical protein
VQFEQDGATIISSDGAETIQWDVATGARKDKVAGQFALTKATNGRYIVTHKDDLIFVYDTRRGVVNADGEEKVPIAFFRAPSPVVSVSCAGDKVAVGCQSGAVLRLHAAWLTDEAGKVGGTSALGGSTLPPGASADDETKLSKGQLKKLKKLKAKEKAEREKVEAEREWPRLP